MKLSSSFRTGHGANIFSAKFLPNAGTPTIVTVAGDHEIRLLEIERLSASGHRPERWEHGGAGYVPFLIRLRLREIDVQGQSTQMSS